MTDIMEARRKAFEFWFACLHHGGSWDSAKPSLARDDVSGGYLYHFPAESFRIWNAALDSVCVELPTMTNNGFDGFYMARSVHAAIERAGLKVKP